MNTLSKVAAATLGALLLAGSASALTLLSYDFSAPIPDTGSRDFTPSFIDPAYTGSASTITRTDDHAVNWGADGWSGGSGGTMSWSGSATSPDFTLSFDGAGFTDFSVSFGYINEHSAAVAYTLDYSINGGGTFQDTGLSGSFVAHNGGSGPGSVVLVDLASVPALNGQSGIALRFNIAGLNTTLKIDDVALSGSAIPEPSSTAALAGLAMLAATTLRRRRAPRVASPVA